MERDISAHSFTRGDIYFNSHAHVERDFADLHTLSVRMISTHTLTWSVTCRISEMAEYIGISTHTLTWSVTRWS